MSLQTSFSFYGKLPCVGDFVGRNIDFAQQQRVDAWISSRFSALHASSPDWLDEYLLAPVWNFIMPAGIWFDAPVVGAIMPSVDKVGRYFPFVFFSRISELSEFSLYCSQFSQAADILPELLGGEFVLDDIDGFIGSKLKQTAVNSFSDVSSINVESNVRDRILAGASYWWQSDVGFNDGFFCAPEQSSDLFLFLFGSQLSNTQQGPHGAPVF